MNITFNSALLHNNALARGLQATAREPNSAREAISSGPQSHFVNVNIERVIHLRKLFLIWFGRM